MLIKKSEAREKQGAPSTIVREYNFPNKELGFAIAEMKGRYPEAGKVVNYQCDETYYVISGTGMVHDETGDYKIAEGDCVFFPKGKRYRAEGENLKIAIATSPSRSLEQYENIPM